MHKLALVWLAAWALAGAEAAMANAEGSAGNQVSLVIIGASYAKGWQPDLPGYEVINKGVGGEETHQVRERFERDALALEPQAVLIWGHINNIHRSPPGQMASTIEKAKADYIDMVSRAKAAGVQVILATEVTLSEAVGFMNRVAAFVGKLRGKQGYNDRINEQVRALNEWLRGYAREQGLQLLDFEKVFDDGRGFRKVEYSSEDGSHISREGYAALTKYARSQLRAR